MLPSLRVQRWPAAGSWQLAAAVTLATYDQPAALLQPSCSQTRLLQHHAQVAKVGTLFFEFANVLPSQGQSGFGNKNYDWANKLTFSMNVSGTRAGGAGRRARAAALCGYACC